VCLITAGSAVTSPKGLGHEKSRHHAIVLCLSVASRCSTETAKLLCSRNTPFTRYSRLSRQSSNRFDNLFDNLFHNRVERTASCSFNRLSNRVVYRFDNRLYTRYRRLSIRLSNGFDNRLNVCIHNTSGCQTGLTTGMTTGCIV